MPAGQADQRPGRELVQGHRGLSGERVVRRDRRDQGGLDQHPSVETVGRGVREPQHGDVEPPGPQLVDQLVGGPLPQRHLQLRVCGGEVPDRVGEHGVGQRGGHADRDPAAQQPAQRGDGVAGVLHGGERGAGVRQHRQPGLGGGDRARAAFDQGCAEFAFQLPQLRAHPGLRDVQRRGGRGDGPGVDDRDQVAQVSQFHKQRC